MKGDLRKILSVVWKKNNLEIGYSGKYIRISVEKMAFDNKYDKLDIDVISEALNEDSCRCTKEARALAETINILDELSDLGYYTSLIYKKRKSLKIKVELGNNLYKFEVLDVDKHDYACFVRKLVKINKDLKKIV